MIINKRDTTQISLSLANNKVLAISDYKNNIHKNLQSKVIAKTVVNTETTMPIRLSFQLMTCAEPVEMVITSIKSLLAIKAPADEILIIDNNNTAVERYEPLAAFCNSLDDDLKVRFYHVDAVAGFKAGALNLALDLMDSECTHVVVVDSDYQALPQARDAITAAIHHYPNHALLQFPQFYRDNSRVEVHNELNHYFNYHLYRPFNRQRALSTGTYAVIRHDALLSLGGWSGASITEDAQMGVLMHKQGLRSQFIPEVIATGLLPTSISDLLKQRRRWIYGNAQVLKSYFSINSSWAKKSTSKSFAYRRAHFSQLSAWINFTGIFILLHTATLLIIAAALLLKADTNLSILFMPLYLVYASYGLYLARRLWAYYQDDAPLNKQKNNDMPINEVGSHPLRVWALHLNFWELGALSWLPVLWGRDKPFICTPKLAVTRSERTLRLENILALPKLLLVLNLITALIVSPFSPLYSPLLFSCALSICLIKLWSAKVIFANYAYKEGSLKNDAPCSTESSVALRASASNRANLIKEKAANHLLNPIITTKQSTSKPLTLKHSFSEQPPAVAKINDKNIVN